MSQTRRLDSAFKDRLSSAALALLLQALFIAAFLHAFSQAPLPRRELAREITFFLPRLSRPEPVPSNEAPRATAPVLTPPVFTLPPVAGVPLPQAPSAQALQNFGQALQGCAPESYANLTPDRKARCARPGDGVAIQDAPGLMGTPWHVRDAALWAAGLAESNTPARVPCLYLEDQALGPTKVAHNVMVDPLCAYSQLQHAMGH